MTMNPQPLHLDHEFAAGTEFGKPRGRSGHALGVGRVVAIEVSGLRQRPRWRVAIDTHRNVPRAATVVTTPRASTDVSAPMLATGAVAPPSMYCTAPNRAAAAPAGPASVVMASPDTPGITNPKLRLSG